MTPLEFFKSWRGEADLCSALCGDWLIHRGHAGVPPKAEQRRIFACDGVEAGALAAAAQFGLAETTEPKTGDVALIDYEDIGPTLCLVLDKGWVGLVARDGSRIMRKTRILRAWSV